MRTPLKLFFLLVNLQLTACDIGYYAHLARGQARIIWRTENALEYRQQESLPDSIKKQFVLVDSILRFAHSLGLKSQGQYTQFYDTGGNPISWNVSAAPPNSFTPHLWHFPLVGAVPYKGFFSRAKAEAEYNELKGEGFDAIMRPVSAYSTLGYLSDPLLSTMLAYPPHQLADLILHELTHATMYAEGDTDFNESVATFIGQQGTRQFLIRHFGVQTRYIQQAEEEQRDRARFRSFINDLTHTLDSLYQTSPAQRQLMERRKQIFTQAQKRFKETLPLYTNQGYKFFLQWEVNNARLLSYQRYNKKLDSFNRILNIFDGDLKQSIAVFSKCCDTDSPWECIDSYEE